MAGKDLELKVRLSAEINELRKALKEATGEFAKVRDSAKKAGSGNPLGGLGDAVKSLRNQVLGLVTAFGAIQGLKNIVRIADDFQQVNARLRLVTSSSEEFARAQAEIFRIAQESRQPLGDVTDLYAKLARSTKDLNVSQSALFRVTETVNKAIGLSGSSAEAAQAALVQFGQGLASGTLRGEELNSILEQTPRLAQAIADGLGKPVGELRKLGEQGELTGGQILTALLKTSEQIDKEYSQLPRTVGQAVTQLRNDVARTLGETNLTPLTGAIDELRRIITDPAIQEGLASLAQGFVNTFGKAAEIVAGLNYLLRGSSNEVIRIDDEIGDVDEEIKDLQYVLTQARFARINAFDDVSAFASDAEVNAKIAELVQKRADLVRQLEGLYNKKGEADVAARRAAEEEKKRLDAEGKRLEAEANKTKQDREAAEVAAKAEKDRLKSIGDIIANLEEEAATTGKTAAEIAQYQLAQLGATDADKARAAQLSATIQALEDKAAAEKKAIEEAEKAAARQKEIAKELADVQNQLLRLDGGNVEARRNELNAEFDQLIRDLESKGDVAGVSLVRRLINTEVAAEQVAQLEKKIGEALDRLGQREQSIDVGIQAGQLNQPAAQEELQSARAQAVSELQQLRAELASLVATDAPGAAEALAAVDEKLRQIGQDSMVGAAAAVRDLRAELASLQESIGGDAINALTDSLTTFFDDLVTGGKSGSDALKDFARNFALSMAQIATRALATYAVLQLLDAVYPGLGRATAAGMSASVNHGGGIVGRTALKRKVDPMLFAGAPRYHAGGVAGLRPGEVPAILQKGEEVLSKSDSRNVMNGGGQQRGGGTRIVNVIDPNMMQDYLSTPAGEQVILNIIQRNGGSVKQVLA